MSLANDTFGFMDIDHSSSAPQNVRPANDPMVAQDPPTISGLSALIENS